MHILGLRANTRPYDQWAVYSEFKEQLVRSGKGWYKTGLPWNGDRSNLPNNAKGSLQQLHVLTHKLDQSGQRQEYDSIISEQKEQGVVQIPERPAQGVEFYIPHKPVVRENASPQKCGLFMTHLLERNHQHCPSMIVSMLGHRCKTNSGMFLYVSGLIP